MEDRKKLKTTVVDRETGFVLEEYYYSEVWTNEGGKRNLLHRPESEGPAVIYRDEHDGNLLEELYYKEGVRHRESGPARIRYRADYGMIVQAEYFRDGRQHRDPAEGPSYLEHYPDDAGSWLLEYRLYGRPYRLPNEGPWQVSQARGTVHVEYCKEDDLFDPSRSPPGDKFRDDFVPADINRDRTEEQKYWDNPRIEIPNVFPPKQSPAEIFEREMLRWSKLPDDPDLNASAGEDTAAWFSVASKLLAERNPAPTRTQRATDLLRRVFRPMLARR